MNRRLGFVVNEMNNRIKLIVGDLAGSFVDSSCRGPLEPLRLAFRQCNLVVNYRDIRLGGMGRAKIDNIKGVLLLPHIRLQLTDKYKVDSDCNNFDGIGMINDIYSEYKKLQNNYLISTPVDNAISIIEQLKSKFITVTADTGYNRETVNLLEKDMKRQGLVLDNIVASDDSGIKGRPDPSGILKNMSISGIEDPNVVLKFGDTLDDINSGRKANVWTVAVLRTCSNIELTEYEIDRNYCDHEKELIYDRCLKLIIPSNPHYIIQDITSLPFVVQSIDKRLKGNVRPYNTHNIVYINKTGEFHCMY